MVGSCPPRACQAPLCVAGNSHPSLEQECRPSQNFRSRSHVRAQAGAGRSVARIRLALFSGGACLESRPLRVHCELRTTCFAVHPGALKGEDPRFSGGSDGVGNVDHEIRICRLCLLHVVQLPADALMWGKMPWAAGNLVVEPSMCASETFPTVVALGEFKRAAASFTHAHNAGW